MPQDDPKPTSTSCPTCSSGEPPAEKDDAGIEPGVIDELNDRKEIADNLWAMQTQGESWRSEGALDDEDIVNEDDGPGQGLKDAFAYAAKNYQPAGPFQVPKLHAEGKVDGSIDIKTVAGTVGTVPGPTLGPPPKRPEPEPEFLPPEIVMPGTRSNRTA